MAIHHWALACGVLLLAPPTWAHRIICPPGDNAVIQACLDRAHPGDELVFAGDYRIDPSQPHVVLQNKSDVRLVGDAGDPPLFRCSVDAGGRPVDAQFTNDGIQVRADGERVKDIVLDGLEFVDCDTAIVLFAENGGRLEHIDIHDTSVSNVYYGILVQAPVQHLAVRNSRILNAESAITFESPFDDVSSGVEITDNVLQGLRPGLPTTRDQFGVLARGVLSGKIARNLISGFSQMVALPGIGIAAVDFDETGTDLDIVHNVIDDVGIGISLGGPALARGRVAHNRVEGASAVGLVLRNGATRRRIGVNELTDNTVDVRLTGVDTPFEGDAGTSNNVVELLCGQTHEDFGIDNRVVVRHH